MRKITLTIHPRDLHHYTALKEVYSEARRNNLTPDNFQIKSQSNKDLLQGWKFSLRVPKQSTMQTCTLRVAIPEGIKAENYLI